MLNNTVMRNTVNIIPQNCPSGFGRSFLKSDFLSASQTFKNLIFLGFFGKPCSFSLIYLPKHQQFEVSVSTLE